MTSPETTREQPPEFIYRDAIPADAAAIARIQYNSWLATYPNESATDESERITADDVRAYLKDIPTREQKWKETFEKLTPQTKIFVAEDGGRVIAFCKIEKKDGEEDNHLDALYVDLVYEGKGIASNLIKRAFAYLGNEKPMRLEVAAYNAHAKAIYEHYGFVEAGDMDFPRPINGKIMKLKIMRRFPEQQK